MTRAIGTLFAASILLMLSQTAWAMGGPQECGTCSATATCSQPTVTGTDACGNTCTATLAKYCNPTETAVCGNPTRGTWSCGGGTCTITAVPCAWTPYGYAIPGDPVYGFPQVCKGKNAPLYSDPNTQTLVGFAAKGNIIVGDYTSDPFKSAVLPKLALVTKPYVIDSTDVNLGYDDALLRDAQGRPQFSGRYDGLDGGYKVNKDGTPALDADDKPIPRKFYESSLPDDKFHELVDPAFTTNDPNKTTGMLGVFFTNHAFAGLVNAGYLLIEGSVVSRDDGLIFGKELRLMHDIRLFNPKSQKLSLPFSIKPPKLMQWQECVQGVCPPPPVSF